MTTHDALLNLTIRRCLTAMQNYGQPLTAAGIAEELGLSIHHLPVHYMKRHGWVDNVGVLEGFILWQITEQGKAYLQKPKEN